ncbi:MAG TPA: ATP-binding protein [Bacteroidota bacterium]|nr:ATP-binding protein [Bacteroidota bacterium]
MQITNSRFSVDIGNGHFPIHAKQTGNDIQGAFECDGSEISEPLAGSLRSSVPSVPPTEPCSSLLQLYQEHHTQSLVVVENDIILGILYRRRVTDQLSTQFGFALYQRRSARDLMESDFLCLDAGCPLAEVVRHALSRPNESVYEDVIITRDGKYEGLLSVQQMLVEQSARIAQHVSELGERNASLAMTNTKLASAMEDLRRTEAQLVQVEKLSGIGTLAAGVAHDFNNMLNIILSSVEMLEKKIPDDPTLHRYCTFIVESTTRAAELTKQLLAFSQKNVSTFEIIKINTVIADTVRLVCRSVNKAIEVVVRSDENIPTIRADRTQLQQVLMNLFLNARDAMNGRGTLTVSTFVVDLDESFCSVHPDVIPGRYVCVRVQDTGCGIPRSILSKIFDPFFTTKGVGKGTGLGLAVVYGIVKKHGGTIEVESTPGVGSQFTLYFRECQESEAGTATERENGIIKGSGGLLIVDDEPLALDINGEMFRGLGYKVFLASDGAKGLEEFMRHRPEIDLILLDMAMPGMDGLDTFRALRQLDPAIKVLVVTGYAEESRLKVIMNEGASGLVRKPFNATMISRTVAELLSHTVTNKSDNTVHH